MAIERLLTGGIRDQIQDLMATEDLVLETFRDLVKDELKAHIRNVIDDDPSSRPKSRRPSATISKPKRAPCTRN